MLWCSLQIVGAACIVGNLTQAGGNGSSNGSSALHLL